MSGLTKRNASARTKSANSRAGVEQAVVAFTTMRSVRFRSLERYAAGCKYDDHSGLPNGTDKSLIVRPAPLPCNMSFYIALCFNLRLILCRVCDIVVCETGASPTCEPLTKEAGRVRAEPRISDLAARH